MANATDTEIDLDDLAEEFAARLRAGEHPSIEDYVRNHPAWGDELRAVLSGVAMLEKFKPRAEASSGGPRLPHFSKPPEKLGEFRIVRELGRGGMGVVYEAVQETLNRSVALKLLPGHWTASDKLRARFRREALAAARLHHTNIVPVFSVGEIDGFCYYAMQLIRGTSLDRIKSRSAAETPASRPTITEEGPPSFALDEQDAVASPLTQLAIDDPAAFVKRIVGIGVQAAEALSYAHSRGVLHRDIKPSNLILDEAGTVWVTDFGVARIADDASLTQSGDVVGTLKYMPPERFAGQSDERGDVYSLGMTLYELLARRSAWPDTNPQRLMKIIAESDPSRLSSINPKVSVDLETVVMKAIARDPNRRYESPAAFAEDLRRVLDDRPVFARRAGAVDRAWRWCRRNPAVAASFAMAVLSMAAITAIFATASFRTAAANAKMEQALAGETKQREQAEKLSELSLEALNRTLTEFAPTRLVVAPVDGLELPPEPAAMPPEAVPLLEQQLHTYEKIAALSAAYPKLQARSAEANHRIGDIQQRLGRAEQAEIAYRAAEELYARLPASENEHLSVKRARIANERGRVLQTLNRLDESAAMHRQAIAVIEGSAPEEAKRPESRYELAAAYYCLGRRDMFTAAPPKPRGHDEHEHHEREHDDRPGKRGPEPHHDGPHEHGPTRKAIVLLEELVREFPVVGEYRHLLARCHREQRGGPESGTERAIKLLRDLVRDFPRVPDYQFDLCETLSRIGWPGTKRQEVEEAVKLSLELMNQYPGVPEYAAAHARHLDHLGWLCYRAEERDAAEANFRKAVLIQRKTVEQYPAVVSYGIWLCLMERSLGKVQGERGELSEAVTLLSGATARADEFWTKNPGLGGLRPFLGMAFEDYANVLAKSGQTKLAEEVLKKSKQFDDGRPRKPKHD